LNSSGIDDASVVAYNNSQLNLLPSTHCRVNVNAKYNNKVYWYLGPADAPKRGTEWKFKAERFRLPAGLTCPNGCVLQW
jgi:hypothetical protein